MFSIFGVGHYGLYFNNLSGPIPASLGNLSNLEYLCLNANDLTGKIPPSLGNLKKLENLNLSNNRLTSSIPASLGNLTQLKYLLLYRNELDGMIPDSLGDLGHLNDLWLNDNKLSGPIPGALGELGNLNVGADSRVGLALDENNLSGPIPPSLGNIINLRRIDLSYNQLEGEIPSSFAGSTKNLREFTVNNNKLCGKVPELFMQNPSDMIGSISYNNLIVDGYTSAMYAWIDKHFGGFGTQDSSECPACIERKPCTSNSDCQPGGTCEAPTFGNGTCQGTFQAYPGGGRQGCSIYNNQVACDSFQPYAGDCSWVFTDDRTCNCNQN